VSVLSSPCPNSPHSSQYVKAGYASDNLPRFTFPSIVGRPILRAEEAIGDVELKVRCLQRWHSNPCETSVFTGCHGRR